ncbi:MAG TPA: hypothetical protein VIY29_24410 [Ktedonobacteraceae bacterium]
MERIPDEDAETAEGVLKQLCRSLQLLASPAQAQIRHFPVPWIVLTDEMADDLGHWAGCVSTYWELPQEQKTRLTELDGFLSEMSGSDDDAFWTDEALFTDSRWEEVRHLAQVALVSFGWPLEVPPPARLLPNGSVIEGD